MLNLQEQAAQTPECHIARCPTCDRHSTFTFLGDQRWSERVAKATGMTPRVYLWQCDDCHTTIVTPDVNV